ncbi:UPF0686 protein C11orf1 homolog [Hypomesus transpacificus]|uniref:UPF0686 protein C11orf1 homolog n=1 Tax=Hypomesus transpacificus TaxID=137520 RepID=UPI001F07F6EE|nr:UPF0686 protein C11orf1 homolog [Hypomesus transpacificus]
MEFPLSSPPFHYGLRASGQGEVWSDARPEDKFRQYGWRCGTNEDTYGPKTLIGNWVEQRKDDKYNRILRPLPSQFSHYFETSYSSAFQRKERRPISTCERREVKSFPGHQPELDPPSSPPKSCYRRDYIPSSASLRERTHTSHTPRTPELQAQAGETEAPISTPQ